LSDSTDLCELEEDLANDLLADDEPEAQELFQADVQELTESFAL
jgi:hypothetical protein